MSEFRMAAERSEPAALSERRALSAALRELAWTIHRQAPDRAGVGPIPTTEIALLKQVIETPGATVGELSATLGLQQSNASAALRSMIARGLVTKEPNATDRRITHVRPTSLGEQEHLAIAEAWAGAVDASLSELSDSQVGALTDAVDAMQTLERALRHRTD